MLELEDSNLYESSYLQLDSSKAKELLGWEPRWSYEQTVYFTARWYKSVCAGADMLDSTMLDIESFCDV